MSLTTYAGLQAAVALELGHRSDVSTQITDWIYMVEQEVSIVLERREMQQRATTRTLVSQPSYSLPSDCATVYSLHLNTSPIVKLAPSDWGRIATSFIANGTPEFWTISQNELLLGPTPDGEYTLEFFYGLAISNLSNSNTTNWLLTKFPHVYYYGTLDRAARSQVVSTDRGGIYLASYKDAIAKLLKHQMKERSFGGGPLLIPDLPPSMMNSSSASILTDQ